MSTPVDDSQRPGRNFIRERRDQLDLTQEEVAFMMGVSAMSISRWENDGVLTVQELNKLAEALQCAPAQLVVAAPRTYVLTPEEEVLLQHFRSVGAGDKRSIAMLARGLHDAPQADFETRKPAAK